MIFNNIQSALQREPIPNQNDPAITATNAGRVQRISSVFQNSLVNINAPVSLSTPLTGSIPNPNNSRFVPVNEIPVSPKLVERTSLVVEDNFDRICPIYSFKMVSSSNFPISSWNVTFQFPNQKAKNDFMAKNPDIEVSCEGLEVTVCPEGTWYLSGMPSYLGVTINQWWQLKNLFHGAINKIDQRLTRFQDIIKDNFERVSPSFCILPCLPTPDFPNGKWQVQLRFQNEEECASFIKKYPNAQRGNHFDITLSPKDTWDLSGMPELEGEVRVLRYNNAMQMLHNAFVALPPPLPPQQNALPGSLLPPIAIPIIPMCEVGEEVDLIEANCPVVIYTAYRLKGGDIFVVFTDEDPLAEFKRWSATKGASVNRPLSKIEGIEFPGLRVTKTQAIKLGLIRGAQRPVKKTPAPKPLPNPFIVDQILRRSYFHVIDDFPTYEIPFGENVGLVLEYVNRRLLANKSAPNNTLKFMPGEYQRFHKGLQTDMVQEAERARLYPSDFKI